MVPFVVKKEKHQCAYIGPNKIQTSRMDKAQLLKVQQSNMHEPVVHTLSALCLLAAILRISFWVSVRWSFAHALLALLPTDVTSIVSAPHVLAVSSKVAAGNEHVALVFGCLWQRNKRH